MEKMKQELQAQQLNCIVAQLDFITSLMMQRMNTTGQEQELKSHLQETASALNDLANDLYSEDK